MLHFHQVLCSDLTIVPSAHARSLFPPLLQDRVAVQFEGLDIAPPLENSQQRAANLLRGEKTLERKSQG